MGRAFLRLLLFSLIASPGTVHAVDVSSGNSMEPGCRLVTGDQPWSGEVKALDAGKCVGVVATLLAVSRDLQPYAAFCQPQGVTVSQGIKVLLKYLDEHPDQLNEPMMYLAISAFREAWPCQ
jgi:hypothetical protein